MRETFVKVVNEDLLPYAARVKPSTLLFWGSTEQFKLHLSQFVHSLHVDGCQYRMKWICIRQFQKHCCAIVRAGGYCIHNLQAI